jgi:hypothetical protein
MAHFARILVLTVIVAHAASGQDTADGVTAEIFLGSAWNLPLPLTLSGTSASARLRARYSTRPFTGSPYYAARLGHSENGRSVELELIHHKLYLENPAPPIERLEISHGYNMPLVNGVGPAGGWQFRIGVGLVVAHPEGRITGQNIGGRYRIAGGAVQLALGRRYALNDGDVVMTATPEVKMTASFARMRLPQGILSVTNLAIHTLAGVGLLQRRW